MLKGVFKGQAPKKRYWHYTAASFNEQVTGVFTGSYLELSQRVHINSLRLVYCKEIGYEEAVELAKLYKG